MEIPDDEDEVLEEVVAPRAKTIEEIISTKPAMEIPDDEDDIEEAVVVEEKKITKELFGFSLSGTKSGEITGRTLLSMLLSYGGTDYKMYHESDSSGNYYMLNLPKSLGNILFRLSVSPSNESIDSLVNVWKNYVEETTSRIDVISEDEKLLKGLKYSLQGGVASITDNGEISKRDLESSIYDFSNYSEVNSEFSRDLSGSVYYNLIKSIKSNFGVEIDTKETLIYGFQFSDYTYITAEDYYNDGGYSIVTQKQTFFVPKGLKKSETFAELGGHLGVIPINTNKFDKSVEIGKRFQSTTKKFDDALECRIIASKEDHYHLLSSDGDKIGIHKNPYNYFKKYYGANIEIKLSDETILVLSKGVVVGMITARIVGDTDVVGVYSPSEVKTELRNINQSAFDFMQPLVSEFTVDDKPTEKAEEKTEEIKEVKEVDSETAQLIDELELQIEFMQDLLDDEDVQGDLREEAELQMEFLEDTLNEVK